MFHGILKGIIPNWFYEVLAAGSIPKFQKHPPFIPLSSDNSQRMRQQRPFSGGGKGEWRMAAKERKRRKE